MVTENIKWNIMLEIEIQIFATHWAVAVSLAKIFNGRIIDRKGECKFVNPYPFRMKESETPVNVSWFSTCSDFKTFKFVLYTMSEIKKINFVSELVPSLVLIS